MRLLRLEMQGFKSFAEKTIIEFGPGVTGIVGPNGCGKSNVSDAIRWVLGEQSIKSLRGSKSEDVIFAGSSGRRALNLAEVSLVFDNADRFFDIDYEEVIVGRRIYRSGEGEYFLNKKSCRLKDIVELFRDTGLGRDALAVVGQNKIDELLSCTAEERRGAFEELAGIARFKNRKKDALRRMEQTEQNLLRIQDLMIAMADELPELEEAKKKTEAYQKIKIELKAGELRWMASEWEKLVVQEQKLKEEEKEFSNVDKQTELAKQKRIADLAALVEKLAESEISLTVWREEQEKLRNRLQEIHTEIAVQKERIEQNESLENLLNTDEIKQKDLLNDLENQLAGFDSKVKQAEKIFSEKKIEFAQIQSKQAEIQTHWNQLQSQMERSRDEGFSSLQEIVSLRNRKQTLQDEGNRFTRQEEKVKQEQELLNKQVAEVLEQKDSLRKERHQSDERFGGINQDVGSMRQRIAESQKRKIECRQGLEGLRREESSVKSRVQWLSDMLENRDGFSQGVRSLLQAKTPWREGILGTVAELFEVGSKYRTALEVTLGGSMQNIICRNEKDAQAAIQYLKDRKAGRVTFLPLTTLQLFGDGRREDALLTEPGCLGRASDFVTAPKEIEKAVHFLLYRTLVVENMEVALKIGRKSNFSVRIVTLQGEILRPGGSMTGGTAGKERESFWGRREEAEKLAEALKGCQLRIQAKEKELIEVERLQAGQENQLQELEKELQEIQMRLRVIAEQMTHLEERDKRIRYDLNELDSEILEIQKQRITLQGEVHRVEQDLQKAQSQETDRKESVELMQGEFGKLEMEREQIQQELTRLQVEVYGREQDLAHLKERKQEVVNNLAGEQQNLIALAGRLGEIVGLKKGGTERLGILIQEQNEKEEKLISVQEGTTQAEEFWKKLLTEKQEKEKEDILLEREETKLREKRHDWDMRKQRLTFEQEKWQSHLLEEFELDVESALKEVDFEISLKGLSDRLAVLRNQLAEIGAVNPYAVEEYDRQLERYSFFETQSADLQSARQSLQRLLNELNREMAEQFEKTFREVSVRFERIFLELFSGGRAELSLTDPTNILETGVEIFVQPPGKKLQNMTLLSGGERALTVIALLFAFMECRPSPFYLADEVDAALDEANVRRFSQFLKDYGEKSQFIVVTHRRGTMEIADTLHGITMEEAGISRLISVRFEGNQVAFEK